MSSLNEKASVVIGRDLSDTELAEFVGGVVEGGCIPDPMKEALKKLQGNQTGTMAQ